MKKKKDVRNKISGNYDKMTLSNKLEYSEIIGYNVTLTYKYLYIHSISTIFHNWITLNRFEFAEICLQGTFDIDEDEAMIILAEESLLHVLDEDQGSAEVVVIKDNLFLLQKMTLAMKMKSRSRRSKIMQMLYLS